MKSKFIALFLFAVSMAFLEAAVVVYLRQFYPSGSFLANRIPLHIYRIELVREASTIVMLLAVGWLAFNKFRYKILAFLWIFAVWDIFYYLFLKITLNWPSSLKTIDVLFLIPFPWLAPVWIALAVWSIIFVASSLIFISKKDSLE